MKLSISILDYNIELDANTFDERVIVNFILSIDGVSNIGFEAGCFICETIMDSYYEILEKEYKRVCEQENGDLMIDRHLTESMD